MDSTGEFKPENRHLEHLYLGDSSVVCSKRSRWWWSGQGQHMLTPNSMACIMYKRDRRLLNGE